MGGWERRLEKESEWDKREQTSVKGEGSEQR